MNTIHRTVLTLIFATASATTGNLTAQAGPPVSPGKIGFSVQGVQGSAGILCSGFQCKAFGLGVTRGETITMQIRAQPKAPWVLLIGANAAPLCLTIPGFSNEWAGPNVVVAVGRVSQMDTIRCWGGLESISIPVPATLPLQTSAVFQVVADSPAPNATTIQVPAFSAPVELTVTK